MYAFPPASELPQLRGDEIMQIWLDPFGVRFLFLSGVQIYAEEAIEHAEPDGTVWAYDCNAAAGPPLVLHRLLYKRIERLEREDFRLTIHIEDGSRLSIFSVLGPYESGTITEPDGGFDFF